MCGLQRRCPSDDPLAYLPVQTPLPLTQRILLTLTCLTAAVSFIALSFPVVQLASGGVARFQDDAFYYIVPARHFIEIGKFTFDGSTLTNGFHPFWMAIIVALLSVLGPGASNDAVVLSITILERTLLGLTMAACCVLAFRSARHRLPWTLGFLFILILFCHPYLVVFQQGMETTLAALLYVGIIGTLAFRYWRILGVLFALLTLCRLDSAVFICAPIIATLWLTGLLGLKRAVAVALPTVAVLLAVMWVNHTFFGDVRTVSGAIKSSFPRITWHFGYLVEPWNLGRAAWFLLIKELNFIVCIVLLLAGTAALMVLRAATARKIAAAIAVSVACLLANLLLFQRWEKSIDPRYFVLPMIGALFLCGTAIEALCMRSLRAPTPASDGSGSRWTALAQCALLLVLVPMATLAVQGALRHQFQEDLIRQVYAAISRDIPEDAVVAATDSGALAFWTGRRAVNLDGLMNDFAYQRRLRDGELAAYLREQGVTHIATALWDRPQTYTGRPTEPMYQHQIDPAALSGTGYDCHWYYVYSYVHATFSDRICLRRDHEVFRIAIGKEGIADAAYVIYRLSI